MVIPSNPKDSVIRKQVQSVKFGFYTDAQVRDRSVIEITSPQAFDPNNTPLPSGLYDPRLGATASNVPYCPTCALNALNCPGHFGHIELCVPCYHPILFQDIVLLLRLKCFHCHRLQAPAHLLKVYQCKFHLLLQNKIAAYSNLDQEMAHAIAVSRDSQQHSPSPVAVSRATVTAMTSVVNKYLDNNNNTPSSTSLPTSSSRYLPLTSYQRQLRHTLVSEFLSACKGVKKCPHCGAAPPKVRGDASNKIFIKYTKTAERTNRQENYGSTMESALVSTSAKDGNESEDTDQEDEEMKEEEDEEEDEEKDDNEDDQEEQGKKEAKDKYMHPGEVQAQLQRTWALDPFLCNCAFGWNDSLDPQSLAGLEKYFLQCIPVPPSRFRPPMQLGSMTVEHSQTQYLGKIIQHNAQIRNFMTAKDTSRAYTAWMELQTTINCFMDSSKDPSANPAAAPPGIRQILERKEGLFRKNMMGKRVDYACRSVISPDPYIGTNEIGLPRYFAHVLTFPTPVTDWNAQKMRQLVERGTDTYPGARWVEIQGKRVDLTRMTRPKREAAAARLLSSLKTGMPSIVGRQLADGDYVLMNRQPTLHKPGIMAHRVRILHNPTQKTIRMHYANCNTYNADYDGDEMNCHFPQSELARAEAIYIARTDFQYIVPTDGSPLRGLIQDHVVGGVQLTKRDTFLEKWEYQQLIFAALSSLPGLEVIRSNVDIEMLPPAIMKPRELWTGKQVISTLLLHLQKGSERDTSKSSDLPGLSLERKAKTPEAAFGSLQGEHLVLIRDGELLRGVLDKSAFGATDFSLVHGVYEAYGPDKAGVLLNALGRLFTAYIQYYAGHSCRMEDLVLTKRADQERRLLVERSYNQGARAAKAWADSEGGKVSIPPVKDQPNSGMPLKPVEAASAAAKIGQLLSGAEGKQNFAALDAYMQSQLNPLASEIVKKCLPQGLAVPFPYNSFSVMTMTGAKGSIVNQSQVSCALGQQALEGRRVPRMSSGRTLPSFAPFDPNPRADGFVMDRFLTGVRPQEYYFHCMAGREGLVDTAVKTSRSGYLQRCLVKHLEELRVCYDHTVRNAEGGVVQFLYGDDGLDPTKASYLDCTSKSFEYMARNFSALQRRNAALPNSSIDEAYAVAVSCQTKENGTNEFPCRGDAVLARRLRTGTEWKRGSLCKGWHKAVIAKVHNNGDRVDLTYAEDGRLVKDVPLQVDLGYAGTESLPVLSTLATIVKPTHDDPLLFSNDAEHRIGVSGACVSERVASSARSSMERPDVQAAMASSGITAKDLSNLIGAKYSSSLCAPGEAVGCIAAQSIGEPSTQLTLNTFHLAGAGANVTLGIPRLREIIMTASREPKTPTMSVPLDESVSEKGALKLTRQLTKLNLMELISGKKGISVTETLECGGGGEWMRSYYVTIKLHPAERIREAFGLSIHDVAAVVAKNFVPKLAAMMRAELRRSSVDSEIIGGQSSEYVNEPDGPENEEATDVNPVVDNDDEGGDDEMDEDAPTAEDGADAVKYRQRSGSASYDGEQNDDDDSNSDSDRQRPQEMHMDSEAFGDASTPAQSSSDKVSPTVNERANTIMLQPLSVDPSMPPLLMVDLVEKASSTTLLRSIKGIQKAFINEEEGRGRCLQTAGVNFEAIWSLRNVDHCRLVSNDIWGIRCAYGVEAARCSIVEQITSVFGAYGIAVDPRHLSLIADYMTFDGGYKPMNRTGMEACSSPFLQMSFETTVNFLKQAAVLGLSDDLSSPSGNLVMGKPVHHGTGSFELLSRK